ncbi:MAG: toxin TcdB middle/N-terminal domain-containing protein, partial [Pyrinomonadaceae bacterium]
MQIPESHTAVPTLCVAIHALVVALAFMPFASVAAIVAGRTPATFAVSSSGAASYTIPLWSPPGVGDVQLNLALVYNSRSPNGVLGMGWSLSGLSAITRCNRTWAQDGAPSGVTLTLNDRFCLDGQQLKWVSGSYGQPGSIYATDIESFSKIEAISTSGNGPASFKVTTKNGLIYEYGLTPDSQIKPGGGATIGTWALSKIRDRVGVNGNRITFAYTNDTANGTYRIASIAYPTTATGQGPFYQVLFAYAARPSNDIPSSYTAGFISRELNRLTTITIRNYGSATATKTYILLYGPGAATSRSRLVSIQECSAFNCLPATSIAYQSGNVGWSSTLNSTGVTMSTASGVNAIPIDFNGDGFTDLLYPRVQSSSTSRWWAIPATPSGFGTAIDAAFTTANSGLEIVGSFSGSGQQQILVVQGGYWWVYAFNGVSFLGTPTNLPAGTEYAAVDYDGDGLPDLASVVGNQIRVRRNITVPPNAVMFAATAETVFTYTGSWSIASSSSSRISMADFDGDGRGDLHFTTSALFPMGATYYRWQVLLSNGFGSPASHTELDRGFNGANPNAADWNADGCTDIIADGTSFISKCAGGFTSFTMPAGNTGTQMVADWDGDSRSDILYVYSGTWYVAKSTGEGYAAGVSTGFAAPSNTAWFVFDQDGDGLADLGYRDVPSNPVIKYRLHNAATIPADLATSFTDGFGINQNPSYKTISRNNYTKHSGATFPEQNFQGALYVVDQFAASDGTGSTFQNQFWYEGARFHAQGRGFEGFYSRRTIDTRNNLPGYDLYVREFPYTGMRWSQRLNQASGTAFIEKWDAVPASQTSGGTGYEQRYFPFISTSTQSKYELGGSLNGTLISETVTQYTYGDGFGNPTNVVTSITDKDPYSPFFDSTWQTTVVKTFENNVGFNCFGLPLTADATSVVPSQTTETRHYSYANNINLCRVSQEVIEPNIPALKVTTT